MVLLFCNGKFLVEVLWHFAGAKYKFSKKRDFCVKNFADYCCQCDSVAFVLQFEDWKTFGALITLQLGQSP